MRSRSGREFFWRCRGRISASTSTISNVRSSVIRTLPDGVLVMYKWAIIGTIPLTGFMVLLSLWQEHLYPFSSVIQQKSFPHQTAGAVAVEVAAMFVYPSFVVSVVLLMILRKIKGMVLLRRKSGRL